ncbi:hypothetical protein FQA39_LY13648 [Lamprigera yunnana]|nr:hypothetical protein FQA39_LY13648 [Lamprigera yunnana]
MSDTSRIHHIVVGLPYHIQDRLDKEEINTTEQLMNQLRRYSQAYPRDKRIEVRSQSSINKMDNRFSENKYQKSTERRACIFVSREVTLDVFIQLNIPGRRVVARKKKRLTVTVNNTKVTRIYDSRSNIILINSKITKNVKDKMWKNEQTFKTISGVQKCYNKIKLSMRIHKIEQEVDAHVIKNDNFSYHILLGLDVIQKFRLMQDDYLNIFQRINDDSIEHIEKLKDSSIRLGNTKQNYPRKLDNLLDNNIGQLNYIGKNDSNYLNKTQ